MEVTQKNEKVKLCEDGRPLLDLEDGSELEMRMPTMTTTMGISSTGMMIGRDVMEGPGVINPSGRRRPGKKVTNGKIGAGSEPKAG